MGLAPSGAVHIRLSALPPELRKVELRLSAANRRHARWAGFTDGVCHLDVAAPGSRHIATVSWPYAHPGPNPCTCFHRFLGRSAGTRLFVGRRIRISPHDMVADYAGIPAGVNVGVNCCWYLRFVVRRLRRPAVPPVLGMESAQSLGVLHRSEALNARPDRRRVAARFVTRQTAVRGGVSCRPRRVRGDAVDARGDHRVVREVAPLRRITHGDGRADGAADCQALTLSCNIRPQRRTGPSV